MEKFENKLELKNKMENDTMDNARTNIDDFLTVRGFYGGPYGGGYYGGNVGGHSPAYGHGTNGVRIDCLKDFVSQGSAGISNAFENAERSRQFTDVRDGQFRGELRTGDKIADICKQINDLSAQVAACCCENQKMNLEAQLKSQECCCEAKLLAVENTNKIMTKMAEDKTEILKAITDQSNDILTRELNAAQARINQLELINACGNKHHHGH